MSYSNKHIKRDAGQKPIPQFYNPDTDAYEVSEGSGGAGKVQSDDGKLATVGAKADAAATTDIGTFSIISFMKRGLQNWTTLLAKTFDVKLTGRKVQLREINADAVTTISAGGNETITITPTVGYQGKVLGGYIRMSAVAGTSGTHRFSMRVGDNFKQFFDIEDAYNKNVIFERGVASSYTTIKPTSNDQIQRNLELFKFTESIPLQIFFVNSTDVDQTGTRTIRLLIEEEAVV